MFNIFTDYTFTITSASNSTSSNIVNANLDYANKSNSTKPKLFNFNALPEELQNHVYALLDELGLTVMKAVSKDHYKNSIDSELWANLANRNELFKQLKIYAPEMTYDTCLEIITNRRLKVKVPITCDFKAWLNSYIVNSNQELGVRAERFIQRSNISRHDQFDCYAIAAMVPNHRNATEPYLKIEIKSKETNFWYNLRCLRNRNFKQTSDKCIFANIAPCLYTIEAEISKYYGNSVSISQSGDGNINTFAPLQLQLKNKIDLISDSGVDRQRIADIASLIFKTGISASAGYYFAAVIDLFH